MVCVVCIHLRWFACAELFVCVWLDLLRLNSPGARTTTTAAVDKHLQILHACSYVSVCANNMICLSVISLVKSPAPTFRFPYPLANSVFFIISRNLDVAALIFCIAAHTHTRWLAYIYIYSIQSIMAPPTAELCHLRYRAHILNEISLFTCVAHVRFSKHLIVFAYAMARSTLTYAHTHMHICSNIA